MKPAKTDSTSLTPQQILRRRNDEEVIQLIADYRRTRRAEIRDRIVLQYSNLVEGVARRFHGAAEPVEDLAQEGYIGLITAIDLYDPTKNVKFSTYSTHFIIGQIKHCLRDRGKIIKEPAWLQELNQKVSRVIESLTQELGDAPSNEEIGRMMGMAEEQVAELMMTREIFKVSSIDGGSEREEDNGQTVNIERRKTGDQMVGFQLPLEERIVLDTAMDKLKDLEQQVIAEFYFKDLNQTEIAKLLGISCNYVSHILRTSTKKLKKILVTDEMIEAQRNLAHLQKRVTEQQIAPEPHSMVDPLTRLYNRYYYESRLEEEMSRSSREGKKVSVIFLRIQNFSPFRTQNGTLPADEALTETTQTIRGCIRRVDILTRYDKDTFALILPFTGETGALVLERLEGKLKSLYEAKGWSRGGMGLTIRMGMATCPDEARQGMALTLCAIGRMENAESVPEIEERKAA